MPARASVLTERYVRDHGVYSNWAEVAPETPTYLKTLREAGYHTAMIGKYLNEYRADPPVPPGWSEWYASVDPSTYRYTGYLLNANGTVRAHDEYSTDAYAHRAVEAIVAARTRAQWEAFGAEHDCCLEPVLELDEALDSALVRAREMVVELDQPGAGPVRQLGVPVKLSRTPGRLRGPGPVLGEHTDDVLTKLAGIAEDELVELRRQGVI
jgi:hypothetical protein